MRVTLQVRETRKPYNWTTVFSARVLYADRQIILVRGGGSHSTFHANGYFRSASFKRDHPAAKNVQRMKDQGLV